MSQPFKTSSLDLAAYLLFEGLNLVGAVESGETGRLFFVFEDSPERDNLIEAWTTGKDSAGICKRYFGALRTCKRELKNPVS